MPTILYIDDTENNRILVTRRLEKKGYQVITAENAGEGLALVASSMPDVILMDMGMPDVDGWSATRELKANPKLRHIPVIALTAHAMPGDREKALGAGFDGYISKPINVRTFTDEIGRYLSSGGSPSAS